MGYADLIIFARCCHINSPTEKILADARYWCILDTILMVKEIKDIDRIIVCSDNKSLLKQIKKLGATDEYFDVQDFHLGGHLRKIINKYNILNAIFIDYNSGPLITGEDITALLLAMAENNNAVMANTKDNPKSIAFRPAKAINTILLPYTINELTTNLIKGGLKFYPTPNTLGANFKVESPSDLVVLSKLVPENSNFYSFFLANGMNLQSADNIIKVIKKGNLELTVIGRVCPKILNESSKLIKSPVKIYSEGRVGPGREDKCEKWCSFIGFIIEELGVRKFFEYLSKTSHGAIIDTRGIFAHFKKNPSNSDAFYSDLLQYDNIKDPFIKEFTREAVQCDIPVMLGGHNLVNGGLWALGVACS